MDADTEYDSDKTPKVFSSEFNLNIFNNSFEDHKEETSKK